MLPLVNILKASSMYQNKALNFFHQLFSLNRSEVSKLVVGGVLFFSIIGSYTLVQELKYGIFSAIVGTYHIPAAKLIAFVLLFPAIMLDGYLVDRFKRYQLVILYTSTFGFIGLLFTYYFSHQEIGLSNTMQSPDRIYGWAFLIYAEAFAPFLLGVFWAFMNSIHNPKNAQKTYGYIVSVSKAGGIITTLTAYLFLSNSHLFAMKLDGNTKLQIILLCSSLLLIFAACFLTLMMKNLNLDNFKGYQTQIDEKTKKTGIWIGIKLLLKNRYVLGIFLMVFLPDIISEIINYKRILIMVNKSEAANQELFQMISKLYLQLFYMHLLGLGISIFFTNSVMRLIGTRVCIFVMPVCTIIFSLTYIITGIDTVIIWLYITIKAMYYTIGAPIRETLYIITNKDIQFKAKFVIDSLGMKFGRNTGQAVNYATNIVSKAYGQFTSMIATNTLFIAIPVLWIVTAYFVGNIYTKNLKENKVIQ